MHEEAVQNDALESWSLQMMTHILRAWIRLVAKYHAFTREDTNSLQQKWMDRLTKRSNTFTATSKEIVPYRRVLPVLHQIILRRAVAGLAVTVAPIWWCHNTPSNTLVRLQ